MPRRHLLHSLQEAARRPPWTGNAPVWLAVAEYIVTLPARAQEDQLWSIRDLLDLQEGDPALSVFDPTAWMAQSRHLPEVGLLLEVMTP